MGAGKLARLLVQHLISERANKITLLNRTIGRANDLAAQFGDVDITTGTLDGMLDAVVAADVVFTCTSSTEPILHRENLEPVCNGSQIMVFDIAVPRNVHSNISEIDAVFAFNVDDLKAVVAQNQESRRQMALEAEALLEEEVEGFMDWLRSLDSELPRRVVQRLLPQLIGLRLNLVVMFLMLLVFLLLLMNALLAERERRDELHRTNQKLRESAAQIEKLAMAQERTRIAREIHDSLGHALTGLNIQLEGALKLWETQPQQAKQFVAQAKEMGSTADRKSTRLNSSH